MEVLFLSIRSNFYSDDSKEEKIDNLRNQRLIEIKQNENQVDNKHNPKAYPSGSIKYRIQDQRQENHLTENQKN